MIVKLYKLDDIQLHSINNIIPLYEKEASKKYKKDHDQQIYLKSRTVLRQNLARILNIDPKKIKITIDLNGKPKTKEIYFNISHSRNYIALAFSKTAPVGIDIQYHDKDIKREDIYTFFMNKEEQEFFENKATNDGKIKFFYNIWTRKESLIKAEGKGFLNEKFSHVSTMKNILIYMGKNYSLTSMHLNTDYSLAVCKQITN